MDAPRTQASKDSPASGLDPSLRVMNRKIGLLSVKTYEDEEMVCVTYVTLMLIAGTREQIGNEMLDLFAGPGSPLHNLLQKKGWRSCMLEAQCVPNTQDWYEYRFVARPEKNGDQRPMERVFDVNISAY